MKKVALTLLLGVSLLSGVSFAQEAPTCKLSVAETISANGKDDAYVTTSCDVESFKLTVYNRMGDPIFKTEDVKEFWDFNEKKAGSDTFIYEQGVYKYTVTYKFANEPRAKSKAGKITFIR